MRKSKFELIFVVAFVLLIIAPNFDTIFKLDPTHQRSENRARAEFPKWPQNNKEWNSLTTAFDSYYTDNFGFRNLLIRMNAVLKFFVLRTSPTDRVVIGKDDGWLFLARQDNIDSYRNLHPFTNEEVDAWVLKIRERQAWADREGIQYIYMVGPDSHTLNPEHLPSWVHKIHGGSRFDQLIENAKRTANIDILDTRPVLIQGKKLGYVSYKTDSHWNAYGAYLAYAEIIKRIREKYPEVRPPISFDKYRLEPKHSEGMDLTLLMGLSDLIPDDGEDLIYKDKDTFKVTEQEGLHFSTDNSAVADFPIAIVCDSMCGSLYPHLARQFSKIRVLWGYPFDVDEMKRYHPKVIIQLVIERSLLWGQLANPDVVKQALTIKAPDSPANSH